MRYRLSCLPACFVCLFVAFAVSAQTLYVDPTLGHDAHSGSAQEPLATLEHAVAQANALTGIGPITIRLYPGVYLLHDKLPINPVRVMHDTAAYILEAVTLPDDPDWSPAKMPVIQSISVNNSETQFPHATGLLVSAEHVKIRGLKFLGNPHPDVAYYYPITKENPALRDLEVSQCAFVGDKEAAKIQGGIWAHGPENKVDHCVFYECRNAVLFFQNVRDFSITHSIVYGAYESAFWLGPDDVPFTFANNVIANSHFFLVAPPEVAYSSAFTNSLIAGNEHHVGSWSREKQQVVARSKPAMAEKNLVKKGDVVLVENKAEALPTDHLHLTSGSAGTGLGAGLFRQMK
ncbi:hypothetical protein SAMN05421823_102160 [Catalinimonas alkaloidigena]|uniref:Right handed beta helix region n=1 Tax=Catalinimonas alkaloidigena TaxID=1075417 RepID=A0A1G9A2G4_9BACT|nr:right-handed parallel beta-helix repeat-containing protein [Catalinimonas alkaloidigena]SDK21437.1 hypothetical protein SAMN05421823_102160 [Catalinimonas alkaloidigena]